jgi:hypothetical protein
MPVNFDGPLGGRRASSGQSASHWSSGFKYRGDGDRRALLESLMALGIEAHWIRWHVANRGAMVCTITSP